MQEHAYYAAYRPQTAAYILHMNPYFAYPPVVTSQGTSPVVVFGATGYAGQVLVRLLDQHPALHPVPVSAHTTTDLSPQDQAALQGCAAVALALPADASRAWTEAIAGRTNAPVIDLSDAHRTRPNVPYGIFELWPDDLRGARLVANPGCYPTASLLALVPLLRNGAIAPEPVAIVGKSGASGAGKGVAEHLHFCELADNVYPYKVGAHRHVPEIERHLGTSVCFVTELLPIVRGLLVTAFVRPRGRPEDLLSVLCDAYAEHPYVHVLDAPDARLGLRHVVGCHDARIAVGPVARSGLVPVFAAIDNLMRGAASQALVSLNRVLGLAPHLGLAAPEPPSTGLPGMKGAWT